MANVYKIDKDKAAQIVADAFNKGALLLTTSGGWGNRKKLADDVLESAGLPPEAVRAVQKLIDQEPITRCTHWVGKLRRWAHKRTNSLPWFTDAMVFVFKTKIDEAEALAQECVAEFNKAVDELCANLEQYKTDYRAKFPNLYREEYYPTAAQLKSMFRFDYMFLGFTLPSGNGTKVQTSVLSADMMKREDQKYKRLVLEEFEKSIRLVRGSFLEMVKHLQKKLAGTGEKFQDASVEKPKQFLEEFFKSMTFLGDKPFMEVAEVAVDILKGVEAQDLRDDEAFRKEMAAVTNQIAQAVQQLPVVEYDRALDL